MYNGLGKITFDLGAEYLIDKVKVIVAGNVTSSNYAKISISDSLVGEAGFSGGFTVLDFKNTSGQYISYETIRKAVNGALASWSEIRDFSVFGKLVGKTINENSTSVYTSANETVTWSLNGGADASKFNIDSSTGALTFKSAPDYENPTDTGTNNSYEVKVRATDSSGNTSDQTLQLISQI